MKLIGKLRDYIRISESKEIARRYFVVNSLDGVMIGLGILLSALFLKGLDANALIKLCLTTGLAMMLSGMFGTYISEEAEREVRLKEMERRLLKKLKNSVIERANRFAIIFLALVQGLSPFLTLLFSFSPIFLSQFKILSLSLALKLSIFLSLTFIFVLGCYLGKISGKNPVFYGTKALLIGVFLTFLTFLLEA